MELIILIRIQTVVGNLVQVEKISPLFLADFPLLMVLKKYTLQTPQTMEYLIKQKKKYKITNETISLNVVRIT